MNDYQVNIYELIILKIWVYLKVQNNISQALIFFKIEEIAKAAYIFDKVEGS